MILISLVILLCESVASDDFEGNSSYEVYKFGVNDTVFMNPEGHFYEADSVAYSGDYNDTRDLFSPKYNGTMINITMRFFANGYENSNVTAALYYENESISNPGHPGDEEFIAHTEQVTMPYSGGWQNITFNFKEDTNGIPMVYSDRDYIIALWFDGNGADFSYYEIDVNNNWDGTFNLGDSENYSENWPNFPEPLDDDDHPDWPGWVLCVQAYYYVEIPNFNITPVISDCHPINGSVDIEKDLSFWNCTIEDNESDLFYWTIETQPNVGNGFGYNGGNGTKICPLTNLSFDTEYIVYVNVTDYNGSGNWNNQTFSFTTEENVIPKADFSYSPNTPTVIDIVTFIDNSSDNNDNVVNWSWDFDDGYISYQKNTTHQYNETGNYTVTLIVTDEDNASGVITKNVTIVNIAPIANFTYSPNNPTNKDILSFIDNSEDIDGIIVSWSWDFGDGENSSDRNPTHTFTSIGIYNVMLIVTDNGGKINNLTLQIEIIKKTSSGGGGGGGTYIPSFPPIEKNEKPVANHNGPFFEFEENLILFNGSKSNDSDGYITNWTWDFGDNNTSYEMNVFHSYNHAGNYSVILTVTDNNSETDTVLSYAVISVKPNLPPNQPIINGSTIGEIGIEYQYLLQATDPDNDNIKYIINWDDGSTHISKYLSSGNTYHISHIWNKAGIYHIEIFVEDKKNMASDNIDILVLIDVLYCFDLGYFIDIDNDKIYDQFYLNETENIIELEFKNGIYAIDINGDGNYEYRYKIEDQIIYEMSKEVENQEISSFFFIIPLILVAAIVIYILIKNDKIKIFYNLIKQKSKKHR